ncbi:HET-domain-containing protein [Annulohypoxylon maeteangense]|uniref:HET-domain-containing protein n=1 Tax=Annulohypoxylon maeteangense TaxID=1927788 RepID=UPI0020072295|nr:HET-domain-containing protein [Annulohypoxylon maeteangense]KAI0887732.1 HET-domain-containing protein [Annulohypoxylon maeteangense]
MLCDVCRIGLEGIWDPSKSKRIGLLEDFPEILQFRFNDDELEEALSSSKLKEPERYVFGHHIDYDSLARSKEQHCTACKEFGVANDRDDVNTTFAEVGYYSVFCIGLSPPEFDNPTMLVYVGDMIEEISHELVAHDENDHLNSMISPSTSDDKTWSLVQSWLDRCLVSHSLCRNQALTVFSPTRLLELVDTGSDKTFRLVQRGEFDPGERYVTLSHCWGPESGEEKLQLVASTMSSLSVGKLVNSLPKTFRHAFEIADRLHIRYIWIDRLCIIQDSEEDWRDESATMQTVYRNGFLNIAALGATNDEGGCFFDRDPVLVKPTIINISPDQDLPSHYRFSDETETWTRDFHRETLITRAWVLQERMLSARNLYFGTQQVFWECCTTNCCETVPAGPLLTYITRSTTGLDAMSSKSARFAWKRLIDASNSGLREDRGLLANLLLEWSAAVQAYSTCNLTYSSDKLIALSGLANDMGAILRDLDPSYGTYLTGMWKLTMPDSLLWKVKGLNKRPSPYRAPSWSWASVDGPLDLPPGGINSSCPLVEVLGTEPLPLDDSAITNIDGYKIVLKGPLCVVKGLRPEKPPNPLLNVHKISSLHNLDTCLPINASLSPTRILFDDLQDQYDEVFILLFWTHPYPSLSRVVTGGLALRPIDDSQTLYRRVGHAQIDVDADDIQDQDLDRYNPVLDACQTISIGIV